MSKRSALFLAIALGLAAIIAGQFWASPPAAPRPQFTGIPGMATTGGSEEPTPPLPLSLPLDAGKVALGGRLFHDTRLSHDNSVSCASCHRRDKGGADGLSRSVGIRGQLGVINAPTVLNSGFSFKQFWDGRAETLEQQIDGPLNDPTELGSSWPEVVAKLNDDALYKNEFAAVYPDGIQVKNIKDAIATFERSLTTPNSRFDRYLKGERDVLTNEEIKGYSLFKSYGCASCHQGVNLGGNLFQKFGVMQDYFKDRGNPTAADMGRFNVTKSPDDIHVFKVPSLRNVAMTPPYFHDGSTLTLVQAVTIMAKYQLGVTIPTGDAALIVRFLETLTGEIPAGLQ